MGKFEFISNEEYRNILERDYEEVLIATKNNALKSSAVISGSIIEALLTNFLIEKQYTKVPKTTNENIPIEKNNSKQFISIKDAGLNNLINECYNKKYITSKTFHLMHYLRDYRNFIHPNKEIREKILIDNNDASIFKNVVDIIVSELSEVSEKEFGPTSDQLLAYILKNEDAPDLFSHIIKKAKTENDVKRLLINLIPSSIKEYKNESFRYCDYEGIPEPQNHMEYLEYEQIENQINKLYKCYHLASNDITEEIKKEISRTYIKTITFEGDIEKEILSNIINIYYFDYLKPDDQRLIKDFYIMRMKSMSLETLLSNINNFTNIFEKKHHNLIVSFLFEIIETREFNSYYENILKYLASLKVKFSEEYSSFLYYIDSKAITISIGTKSVLTDRMIKIKKDLSEPEPEFIPF